MQHWELSLPLIIGLSACTGPEDVPTSRIEADWTETLGRLGLFAVYPPNEDVVVGDVFLGIDSTARPGGADNRFAVTRLVVPPCAVLMDALGAQGRNRPRIEAYQTPPPTEPRPTTAPTPSPPAAAAATRTGTATINASGLTATATFTVPTPAAAPRGAATPTPAVKPTPPPQGPRASLLQQGHGCGNDTVPSAYEIADARNRGTTPAIRLMQTDTPQLDVARVRQFSGGISGAYQAVAATLGLQSRGSVSLTLRLGGLQNLTLNEVAAHRMVREIMLTDFESVNTPPRTPRDQKARTLFSPTDLLRSLYQASDNHEALVRLACTDNFRELRRNNVRIVVANRVLYASSIEYAFSENSSFGLRAAAALDPQALVPGANVLPRAATLPAITAVGAPTDSTALLAAVNQLNEALAGAGAAAPTGLFGANLSYGVSTSGRFTIKQDYPRPMAVGFGSALSYWLEHAMIPVRETEITEFASYCQDVADVHTTESTAVQLRLRNNLNWLRQAYAGGFAASGNPAVLTPANSNLRSLGRARTF